MIYNNNYLADILRVCEIKDLIWVMRFQSPLVYIYINSQRFKHNFTPDMLFHLESLGKKKQIVNMRETKLDQRNYHDFDK